MSDSPSACRPRVASSSTATASTPPSGADGPNAHAAAHSVAAARAPSATPMSGSAVSAPRPKGADLRTGTTVPNASAAATERITQ